MNEGKNHDAKNENFDTFRKKDNKDQQYEAIEKDTDQNASTRLFYFAKKNGKSTFQPCEMADVEKREVFIPIQQTLMKNYVCIAIDDDKLLVSGGLSSKLEKAQAECFEFSLETKTIKQWAPMLQPRHSHSIHVNKGKVFVIGGRNSDNSLKKSCEVYELDADKANSNQWKAISEMKYARSRSCCFGTTMRCLFMAEQISSSSTE